MSVKSASRQPPRRVTRGLLRLALVGGLTGALGHPSLASEFGRVGITVDAGVPDLLQAGVVLRPVMPLRFTVTGGTNAIGGGVRAGVAIKAPWDVAPALALEVGHFFPADAQALAGQISGADIKNPVLERVGYSYANAHVGLELGNVRSTFYVHVGMSEVHATVRGVQAWADQEAGVGTVVLTDPTVRVVAPSARVGVIGYFRGGRR